MAHCVKRVLTERTEKEGGLLLLWQALDRTQSMKINSVQQSLVAVSFRPENTKAASTSGFHEQLVAQDATRSCANKSSSGGERLLRSAKTLSVSTALERGKASADRASSSSVISNQAKPFLNADEVSFFEKIIRNSALYGNSGAYGQQNSQEANLSFSI